MRKLFAGPCLMAALMAVSLGIFALIPVFSAAQEPSEASRKIISRMVPVYPELARTMQIHGTVRVNVVIAPNGKVKLTQVVGGNPVLIKAAVDAIDKWRWAPASQETKELIQLDFHP
jgi:TonB family protein